MERAVATPAIFPIPTVLARAVDAAWKGVILPCFRVLACPKIFPKVFRKMKPSRLIWKARERTVKNTATAAMKTMVHGPHRILSKPVAASRILSNTL
jgi:hypothetical protein